MTMGIARRGAEFKPSMLTVCDGQTCTGFVINRGRDGFEAFDSEERSLGKYSNQHDAVQAIPAKDGSQ